MNKNIRTLLSDKDTELPEILLAISDMSKEHYDRSFSIGISANITIDNLVIELKRQSYLYEQNPEITMGDYKNNIGNAENFVANGVKNAIFLWFYDAIVPSCQTRAGNFSEQEISELCLTFATELKTVLSYSKKFDNVFIPKMHKVRFGKSCTSERAETELLDRLNAIILSETNGRNNVFVLEIPDVLCRLGVSACIDERMYFLYKKPYTQKFVQYLAEDMFREIRGNNSYYKKVLVLDCDNTLWHGISGEGEVYLSPEDYPGNVYWTAQQFFLSLYKRGVLLALCSRNDKYNINSMLENHEFCVLRPEHIVAKRTGWNRKSTNIKSIAEELNLGLDSFVFLDDSEHECEEVRMSLPEVAVYQVPRNLSQYPALLKLISTLFKGASHLNPLPADGETKRLTQICPSAYPLSWEEQNKTEEYKKREKAKKEEANCDNKDDYYRSLATKVTVKVNEYENIIRIAELTQKTNQFNLTTKRYSESDIEEFMKTGKVYSAHVEDKFGNLGLVGVCIVSNNNIDTFLISCRIIGRGIEYAILETVLNKRNNKNIEAEYIPTAKNKMVENLYKDIGFKIIENKNNQKIYQVKINKKMLEIIKEKKEKYFLE